MKFRSALVASLVLAFGLTGSAAAFDQLAKTGAVTAAPLELPRRSIRSAVSQAASVCPNQP